MPHFRRSNAPHQLRATQVLLNVLHMRLLYLATRIIVSTQSSLTLLWPYPTFIYSRRSLGNGFEYILSSRIIIVINVSFSPVLGAGSLKVSGRTWTPGATPQVD